MSSPGQRLSVTCVRYADAADLPLLSDIERAADQRFAPLADVSAWPAPPSGVERNAVPGYVLVVGSPALGFAHVTERGGADAYAGTRLGWHLEQIAVHPSVSGRGLGTMLLLAAMGVAMERGAKELSLHTFAGVPWNAPWYARRGFVEVTPEHHPRLWDWLAPLREGERRWLPPAGLERVAMVATLSDEPTPRPAASVIPLRTGRTGLEVFVQHRATTMDFAPGAVVFPGGRVDPTDAQLAALTGVTRAAAAAAREVAEETGAIIDPAHLRPWDRWITPIGYPRRFDVEFFVVPVEGGDEFRHLTSEAVHSEWMPVADLVAEAESGTLTLVPPTRTIVDELSALATLEAVMDLRPTVEPIRHDLAGRRPRT